LRTTSIKGKTGLIILIFFILYGALSYGIHRATISPYFERLEVEEARRNLFRVLEVIFNEVERIEFLCRDWASWDDSYEFMTSGSSEHLEKHLIPKTFITNRINLIAFCDAAGDIVWWNCYDLIMEEPMAGVESLRTRILAATPLFSFDREALRFAISGVLIADPFPLLVSSHPVLSGDHENPVEGYIVFGRFLTPELEDEFEEQSEVDFDVVPLKRGFAETELGEIANRIDSQNPYVIQVESDGSLHAYARAPDIFGSMALLVSSKIPGKIIQAGDRTMLYAMASMLIAGVVLFFGLRLILQRVIATPVSNLTESMIQVGKTGDLSARIRTDRRDEIGLLGKEFDGMLERLEEKDRELVSANIKLEKEVKERQRLINELQQALSEVKTLSGLLPICAQCKKIRDDKGYWNQIETYIHKHSGAKFSHGMCPECFKKLYPELYEEKYGMEDNSGTT
jgi:sensor domain CHASE-containing protein